MYAKPLLLVIAAALFQNGLSAQPGSLDPLFSGDGKVITAIGTISDNPFGMVLQPDGKIIVCGNTKKNSGEINSVLVRYQTNGMLDNTFGINGKAISAFSDNVTSPLSVDLQPDGKIVTAGLIVNDLHETDFLIARYNANGKLDSSFNTNGHLIISLGENDGANCVAIQSDGKILAAGYINSNSNVFALLRCNPDGSLDTTFNHDGIVTSKINLNIPQSYDEINALTIQSDGKIIAAGRTSFNGTDNDFALARYLPNGSLDNSFGTGGIVTMTIGFESEEIDAMKLQADGKIVVGGFYSYPIYNYDFALVRYLPNGELDNTFGSNGIVKSNFGQDVERIYGIAIQPDGKILASGIAYISTGGVFALARYNIDGTLDNDFGVDGKVTTDFGQNTSFAIGIGIQPSGKIVLAGGADTPGGSNKFALAQYLSGLNVGIIDFTNASLSALIYPNPIVQNALLEYTLEKEEIISIELLGVDGGLIKRFISNQKQGIGAHYQTLELPEDLPQGGYFLALTATGGGRILIKIVK